ncbi:MAG: class I SAM-dependent methyltransferase [Sphingomicrobium sp.]
MEDQWRDRLRVMEAWYDDLLGEGFEQAEQQLLWDHRAYAERLAQFHGRVIDVGGGAGLARRFLPDHVDYWVVDPSATWQAPQWREFAAKFHRGQSHFTVGVGEDLPFGAGEFDGALAMWSFNHADDPTQCLREIGRVLKPGGRALVVLEDMEPTIADVGRLWLQERSARQVRFPIDWHQDGIATAADTLRHRLARRPWPLQPDHTRVDERQLKAAMHNRFKTLSRSWEGGFLAYELERLGPAL